MVVHAIVMMSEDEKYPTIDKGAWIVPKLILEIGRENFLVRNIFIFSP